jgi:hypothetical protein
VFGGEPGLLPRGMSSRGAGLMARRAIARSNVLRFHTARWYARERAKKRAKQLLDEMAALQVWLEPEEECDARRAASASGGLQRRSSKDGPALRLCKWAPAGLEVTPTFEHRARPLATSEPPVSNVSGRAVHRRIAPAADTAS